MPMISRLLYKFSLLLLCLFGQACDAAAKDIPFFTVEHNDRFYAVSKQTAPISFNSDYPEFNDYCHSLSTGQGWQLALMTDEANFLEIALAEHHLEFVDSKGKSLHNIALIQGIEGEDGFYYGRTGRGSLRIKKARNDGLLDGLEFYPLCMTDAAGVMEQDKYESIVQAKNMQKYAAVQQLLQANARVAQGQFKGGILGKFNQFNPVAGKQKFIKFFQTDIELTLLDPKSRQSRDVIYNDCIKYGSYALACRQYVDKIYAGVALDFYALSVGGKVDERVQQELNLIENYPQLKVKAKEGDKKAYKQLEKLSEEARSKHTQYKQSRLAGIFGRQVSDAEGIVIFNEDELVRYAMTLDFLPEIHYQWRRLIKDKFGKPDFNFSPQQGKEVFVYTRDKHYHWLEELHGQPEEREYKSWLASKPKLFFKITAQANTLRLEFENRSSFYSNYQHLAATAESHVRQARKAAEQQGNKKSQAFKL